MYEDQLEDLLERRARLVPPVDIAIDSALARLDRAKVRPRRSRWTWPAILTPVLLAGGLVVSLQGEVIAVGCTRLFEAIPAAVRRLTASWHHLATDLDAGFLIMIAVSTVAVCLYASWSLVHGGVRSVNNGTDEDYRSPPGILTR